MKKFFLLLLTAFLCACSSMIPYKNQNLDYLHGIEQDPSAYRGKVVSFGGEVKGVTEDTRRMRLVIKIDVPFYYYATGKDPLSYELLLISFDKKGMPQMTGIQKGSNIKVLARVANYETRKNLTGKPIAVLHLIAFALADRDREKDFFRPEPPYKQLYESWKAGRLFFDEQPQEIEARYPAPQRKTMTFIPLPSKTEEKKPASAPGIVYDEEEPAFVLPPDPEPEPKEEPAEKTKDNALETDAEERTLSGDKTVADPTNGPDEPNPLPPAIAIESVSHPEGETTQAEDGAISKDTLLEETPNTPITAEMNDTADKQPTDITKASQEQPEQAQQEAQPAANTKELSTKSSADMPGETTHTADDEDTPALPEEAITNTPQADDNIPDTNTVPAQP